LINPSFAILQLYGGASSTKLFSKFTDTTKNNATAYAKNANVVAGNKNSGNGRTNIFKTFVLLTPLKRLIRWKNVFCGINTGLSEREPEGVGNSVAMGEGRTIFFSVPVK